MRIVYAALSARTRLSLACAAVFAVQPAWADESTTDRAIIGRPASDTSVSHPSVTNNSANSLTEPVSTLQAVSVTAARAAPAFAPDTPGVVETVTREQIDARNIVNTEDALKYAPNVMVRKRFTGDRNSVFAGRDFNELQSARGLVYADGLLLSNLLGNSYSFPPRWSMVFPDEIQQVDVIYGPFSALYPGNSLGATVLISTRMPKQFEASADVKAFTQHFSLFGVNQNFNGSEASASIGDRIGKFSYFLGVNHLENTSQPLQFATLAKSSTPAKAGDTPVTGAYFYNNQTNTPSTAVGALVWLLYRYAPVTGTSPALAGVPDLASVANCSGWLVLSR